MSYLNKDAKIQNVADKRNVNFKVCNILKYLIILNALAIVTSYNANKNPETFFYNNM